MRGPGVAPLWRECVKSRVPPKTSTINTMDVFAAHQRPYCVIKGTDLRTAGGISLPQRLCQVGKIHVSCSVLVRAGRVRPGQAISAKN